jgi:hypothetical protein
MPCANDYGPGLRQHQCECGYKICKFFASPYPLNTSIVVPDEELDEGLAILCLISK